MSIGIKLNPEFSGRSLPGYGHRIDRKSKFPSMLGFFHSMKEMYRRQFFVSYLFLALMDESYNSNKMVATAGIEPTHLERPSRVCRSRNKGATRNSNWCARQVSNPRPSDLESAALPLSYKRVDAILLAPFNYVNRYV